MDDQSSKIKEQYEKDGIAFLEDLFDGDKVNELQHEIKRLLSNNVPGTVHEDDGKTVRAMHGCHLVSETFDRITRHPLIIDFVESILGTKTYVHQFKINFKKSFTGEKWEWHQDFIFWNREDGIPNPHLVNVLIALDDINEFNGPLFLIPRSHSGGVIEEGDGLKIFNRGDEPNWKEGFARRLKYSVEDTKVDSLVREHGLMLGKCKRGGAMFFDSNIVHASSPNISPYDRKIIIITYNSVNNSTVFAELKRPAYISSRNKQALEPVD